MKIAISYSNGRISPVFDSSTTLLVVDLSENDTHKTDTVSIAQSDIFERAKILSGLKVETLICGAISGTQERAIENRGIHILGFVCGDVECVISAYKTGRLTNGDFYMPGCGEGGKRRCRRGMRNCRQR